MSKIPTVLYISDEDNEHSYLCKKYDTPESSDNEENSDDDFMLLDDNTSINSDDYKSQSSIDNDISISDDEDTLKKSSDSITPVDNVIFTSFGQIGVLSSLTKEEFLKHFNIKRKIIQNAIKNGVAIAMGSDDNMDLKMPFAEASKRTLISYFESGMTISEILKTATINASRQLNWSDKIGIIKSGYFADIIAVDNDLDKNINAILNVHFVMKDGKVYVNN